MHGMDKEVGLWATGGRIFYLNSAALGAAL